MRLLIGLILWVGTPFYIAAGISNGNLDPGTAGVMLFLAVGLAVGEYIRYQQRARRNAAMKAQQNFWISQKKG
jgi:hypothetical protein